MFVVDDCLKFFDTNDIWLVFDETFCLRIHFRNESNDKQFDPVTDFVQPNMISKLYGREKIKRYLIDDMVFKTKLLTIWNNVENIKLKNDMTIKNVPICI